MDRAAKKVSFIVDGFNLYYSLREMEGLTKKPCRWLDLRRLCASFLQPIGSRLGCRAELGKVHYFSAWVTHRTVRDRGVVDRHRTYVSALESTDVSVTMSQFKYKDIRCLHCWSDFKRPEEKETDVAMAMKLLEVFAVSEAPIAVLMTGDSDLVPRGSHRAAALSAEHHRDHHPVPPPHDRDAGSGRLPLQGEPEARAGGAVS